jgi:hypothetical protein
MNSFQCKRIVNRNNAEIGLTVHRDNICHRMERDNSEHNDWMRPFSRPLIQEGSQLGTMTLRTRVVPFQMIFFFLKVL